MVARGPRSKVRTEKYRQMTQTSRGVIPEEGPGSELEGQMMSARVGVWPHDP